jgi:hypothetical protein
VTHTTRAFAGKRREEGLAQPAVEQAQVLRGVDRNDDAAVAEIGRDGGEEARGRRLDRAAVDRDDRHVTRRRLGPERAQQRRLPGARDAVDDRDDRAVVVEESAQGSQLRVPPDDRRAALGQQRSEGACHRGQSGSGAATIVETPA